MTKVFWKAAGIRALRTMAQCAIAYIGSGNLLGDVNWVGVVSSALMGGIVSVLMSIATGLPEVPLDGGGDDSGPAR